MLAEVSPTLREGLRANKAPRVVRRFFTGRTEVPGLSGRTPAWGSCAVLQIAAGQTESESGIIRDSVDLGAAAALMEPAGGSLSIFGPIGGPASGTATLDVAAGATLYVAGTVGGSVVASFAGSNGTLELADLYLPQMSASIAGFAAGQVIDVISGTITDASISGGGLTLSDEGTTVATLALADAAAAGESVFAIPDAIDGTRILLGPAMQNSTGAVPAGTSSGQSFVWTGGGSGCWSSAGAWRVGAATASTAPGAHDSVMVAGTQSSVLTLAGNGAAASLATQGLVALSGGFTVGALTVGATSQDALVLSSGCSLTAGTVTLVAGVLQVAAAAATLESTGTVSIGQGVVWVADGGLLNTPTLLLAGGTLRLGTTGTVAIGGGSPTAGLVAVEGSGLLAGYGTVRGPVLNDGTLRASEGILAVYGAVSGSGSVQIGAGATLYLPMGAGAQQQIAFQAGTGTLELFGSAAACAAVISGFGVGDVIDIASATLSQPAWTPAQNGTGVLSLGSAGTLEIGLAPDLNPAQVRFSVAADGIGGSEITLVPCFCAGTRLAAPGGSIPVEQVRVGDRLLTHAGAARRVRWIGRRSYSAAFLARERQLRPVRIIADALGPGLPFRDLLVSPQHALALPTPGGTRLVPAVALVDGRAVRREQADGGVTYVHIELDSHDLLLAEGVAAESFLAEGVERRSLFQAHCGTPARTGPACYPRLEDGPLLEAVRAASRLGTPAQGARGAMPESGRIDTAECGSDGWRVEGWALSADRRYPAAVDLLLEGAVCGRTLANFWRPDLDRAGLRGGACGFRAKLPAGLSAQRVAAAALRLA